MGGPYGLQPTGFVIKPEADIRADLEAGFRATFGNSIDLEPNTSDIGMEIGIMSGALSEAWEVLEAIKAALDPDAAAGAQQDAVCALTGTVRDQAKLTHVLATLTGDAGTLIQAGSQASILGTGAKFKSLADATIGAGGTVAGVEFVAVDPGPTPAYAGTLTVIETPRAGWTGITNPADHFILGADVEGDPSLRIRREGELRAQGNAATEAIRQKVLEVSGVTACRVFQNEGDVADADGVPPHSIEVVVEGGADADIRAAIYAAKGAGTRAYGSTAGTVTDSFGGTHEIDFSRFTDVPIYVIAHVKIDASTFPADGDAQIAQAIANFGDANYTGGSSVVASRLAAVCFGVSGVTDAPSAFIGEAPAPAASYTIPLTSRQIPKLDTSRITVTHV